MRDGRLTASLPKLTACRSYRQAGRDSTSQDFLHAENIRPNVGVDRHAYNPDFRSLIGKASVRVTARRRHSYCADRRFDRNGNRCGILSMLSSTGLAGN
jgi:hypothetical protein